MSILRLRLLVYDDVDLPEFGVVANIYDISSPPGKRNNIRDLVIPAGMPSGEFEEVELPPGEYVVEAVLPSGEILSEEVCIMESAGPIELVLQGERSPHEWLGLQHFAGNVEQKTETYDEREQAVVEEKAAVETRVDLLSVLTLPPDAHRETEALNPDVLLSRGFFFIFPQFKDVLVTMPLPAIRSLTQLQPKVGMISPSVRDHTSQAYYFGPRSAISIPFPGDYRSDRFERHYFFVRGRGIPFQYSVLPIPWMQSDLSGEATVQTLVRTIASSPDTSPQADPGFRVAISVGDRVVGSVISYLGAGRLPSAATIMERAREVLMLKLANPLAAAAGAYVLLGTKDLTLDEKWHDWVRNLMNWFPWLPDGAIQHAWIKMNQQEGDDNLREARASLLEGYRRGLPFYSKGVSLMLDALTLFDNDARASKKTDEEIAEALKMVRQLALRTNVRQPFTSILLH